ncbi:PaaI family thioesterase [Nocardioides allogilvus]|uniref:PaaI family thioesterase n=1 Tax=Nocardioides allogilvus TaxID=2072017 RepID=UPI000D31283F|nr:PaaI family thioesterase [Nocardioides allogilvus]
MTLELTAVPNNKGVDAAVAAARRVIETLLHAGDNSAAEMSDVADRLNAVADHLEDHVPTVQQRLVDMWAGEGVTRHDPVTGPENAIAPPLHLIGQENGSIEARVTLGLAYQGPPGCVHGGVSALLLDHTLGVANHWAGDSGMTGTLTLRYHRPTPLFEELTISARQESVDGRKIRTLGTISVGGEVCVSADGLFINTHLPRPQ